MKTIAFFNCRGGVGATSLVYHVGAMFAARGLRTVLVDLDPQARLTTMCLNQRTIDDIWSPAHRSTIFSAVAPALRYSTKSIFPAVLALDSPLLDLFAGDPRLAELEGELSHYWFETAHLGEAALIGVTAFFRAVKELDAGGRYDVALLDFGPNLGAINRSATLAADFLVIPTALDICSFQSLEILGSQLRQWQNLFFQYLAARRPKEAAIWPHGSMQSIGYVVSQLTSYPNGNMNNVLVWSEKLPEAYATHVLGQHFRSSVTFDLDENKLAHLKEYASLIPMAMEARKPVFSLSPADGAIGGFQTGVKHAYDAYSKLVDRIAARAGITLPK
jgi:cellulose biosynthesis protein BcsQ